MPGEAQAGPVFLRGQRASSSVSAGVGSGVPGTSCLGLLAFQSPWVCSVHLQPSNDVGGALSTQRRHPSECSFRVEKKQVAGCKRRSRHFLCSPLWPAKEAAVTAGLAVWGGSWGTAPVGAGSTRVPAVCPHSTPQCVFLKSQDGLGEQGRSRTPRSPSVDWGAGSG